MKKTIKTILLSSFIVLSFTFAILLTACKKTKTTEFVNQGEVGDYYASALAGNAKLSLNQNSFTLTSDGESLSGVYTFDGKNLVITFDGDSSGVNVTFGNNQVSFTYKGTTYTLYKDVKYNVTFDSNGGSNVSNQSVQNGQKVNRPADPTKEGYTFLGWYKDSQFNNSFNFDNEIVTSDLTLYAQFGQNTDGKNEFTVSFVSGVDGVNFDSVQTYSNTLYNLPTVEASGKTFAGWWVSQYNDPTKLSYKYETGMKLYQDTTLYAAYASDAPLVSVVGNTISWDSKGVGKSYTVNVKDESGATVYTKNVTTTSDTFNFSSANAGNYTVEVTTGNYTGKSYYINKGLASVSKFSVNGFELTWNSVPNATGYSLVIDNSNAEQSTTVELGNVTTYNFESLSMPKNGIKFTVVANANGFVSSTSSEFVVSRSLEALTGLKYDNATQSITWTSMADAESYRVEVTDANGNTQISTVETNSFAVDDYYGQITYSVTPMKVGFYSEAATGNTNKAELSTPTNIQMIGNDVMWSKVTNAESYVLTINGQTYNTQENKYTLTEDYIVQNDEFSITVQAIAAAEANNSKVSKQVNIGKTITTISYANGVASWNSVLAVSKFAVKVDNGAVQSVSGDTKVNLAFEAGKHTISVVVCKNDGTYDESKFLDYEFDVYTLSFNTNGGSEVEDYYFVTGDNVPTLPVPSYNGYTFVDWYVSEDAASNDGEKFTATTLDAKSNVTIYAGWVGNNYTATLNYTEIGTPQDATSSVVFGSNFNLPVVVSTTPLKAFYGWYTEPNNQGIRYTDQEGASRMAWRDAQDMTLYAGFIDVFTFELSGDGKSYSVSAGEGAQYLKEVTVPAKYKDLPVLTVESYAFKDYTNLTKIYLPNSIKNIEISTQGPDGTSSAFKGCYNLTGVYMYEVEGTIDEDVLYYSYDGTLVYKNTVSTPSKYELKWIPYGTVSGSYTIPSVVTNIPINTFNGCAEITEIIVPASVVEVSDNAFAGCYKLANVVFEEAADPANEQQLILGSDILRGNSTIETLNLPLRVESFSANTLLNTTGLKAVNFVGTYADAKYKSVDGVVYSADGKTLLYFPRARDGEFVIPSGVFTVAQSAFETCRYVSKITIPGHVTTIEDYAFKTLSRTTDIVFQGQANDSPLSIGVEAFYNAGNFASSFTELVLPYNLKAIGKNAFGNMTNITSVKIYSTVENLEFASAAFGSTGTNPIFRVTDLWLSKDVHTFSVAGVFGATKLERVVVEEGNAYYKAIDNVLYDADVKQILYYPSSLEGEFTLPSTIEVISDRVFEEKYGMTKITISKSVKTIGAYAFYNCTNLATIVFEDGGTENLTLGEYSFSNCKSITSLSLPERTTTVGSNAFNGCTALTTMNFGKNADFAKETVTVSIARTRYNFDIVNAFTGCTSLTAINVDSANEKYLSVEGVLAEYLLDNDNNKTGFIKVDVAPMAKTGELVLPNTVSVISYLAFENQSGITKLSFADGVTSLSMEPYSFSRATGLKNVVLPEGLSEISSYSFIFCTSLETVNIPASVTKINNSAFSRCSSLANVNFAENRTLNLEFADGDFKYEGSESASEAEESRYSSMDPISIFYGCDSLKELVLPVKTTKIGSTAFGGMNGLEKITIPYTVTSIGDYAFVICPNLKTVVFTTDGASQLTSIGQGAFRGAHSYEPTSLQSINLPAGSYTIGAGAFKYTSLANVVIPEGVSEIGTRAFYGNALLESVSLPQSLKVIGEYAFANNKALTTVNQVEGSLLEGIGGFAFANTKITSFTFPTSIKQIGHEAFLNCTSLTSLTFANGTSSLTQIGYKAFSNTAITSFTFPTANEVYILGGNVVLAGASSGGGGKEDEKPKEGKGKEDPEVPVEVIYDSFIFDGCKKLTTVTISESVSSVDQLFVNCPALTTVTIAANNQNLKHATDQPIILNLDGTALRYVYGKLVGEFSVPEGITQISQYAFSGQTGLTKVTFPQSVYEIGEYAFKNCLNLETVEFASDSALAKIGNYVFADCKNLKNVSLPRALTEIGNYTFAGCKSLTSISLPSSVAKLGDYAFANCGFTELTVPSSITTYGKGTFANNNSLTSVSFATNTAIVGTYMFANCSKLNDVTLPSSLTYLAEGMFQNCTSLTTVELPTEFYRLGGINSTTNENNNFAGYVFDGCTALSTINLSDTLIAMGSYTFRGCTSLTEITIPVNVINMGEHLFDGCSNLVTATLLMEGAKANYLPQYMFYNCTSLKNVEIPDQVARLGGTYSTTFANATAGYVFYGCASLETIEFKEGLQNIGQNSFNGCINLKEVTFPSTLIRLGASSFENTGLETVTFSEATKTLTYLGNYNFRYCHDLVTVNNMPTWNNNFGYGTFTDCYSLRDIKAPANMRMLSNETFMNCRSLIKMDFSGTSLYSIGTNAFLGCTSLSQVMLPAEITLNMNFTIGVCAFKDCIALESVVLPTIPAAKFYTINYGAFSGSGLTNFTIYKQMNTIQGGAFNNCPNLQLTVDSAVTKFAIVDDMFLVENVTSGGVTTQKIVSLLVNEGDVVIPEGMDFQTYAFYGVRNIDSITLPSTLTSLTSYVFMNCQAKEVILNEGLTSMSSYVFQGSTVESVVLPSTLTSIPALAFKDNTNLKSIVIPGSVTTIYSDAFRGCTALESVTLENGVTEIGDNAFRGCTSLKSITFPESLKVISNYAFEGSGLTSLVIPETVTTIGKFFDVVDDYSYDQYGHVFENCKDLETVTFYPTSISSKYMFSGCDSLKTITFPNGLVSVDGYAFNGCSSLETFEFAEGLKNIGPYAFSGTSLKTVSLPSSLTKLCDGAFANCLALTSVTFSSGLKYLGAQTITALDSNSNDGGVFEGCTALTTVVLPTTLFAINGRAFANCTSISSIVIGDSVSYVGDGAFAGWTESQTVNSTQSEYVITGLWEYNTTENGMYSYESDSNARFVFDYSE